MACIRKRRGKYVVDYRDGAGVRRWVTCDTRDEADGVLADKIKESSQAAPTIADRKVAVKAYGAQWLAGLTGQVRPRTLAGYRDIFERYIEPKIGGLRLLKLHRGHVKALLGGLRADGFSKDTVRLTRATLSVMLGDAVEDHLLMMNPVMLLARRGRRKQAGAITKAERQKKITPLTYEQLATFLATAQKRLSRREAAMFLLFADAGPRPGEALAVRWEDFDANARTLAIERAVSHGEVGPTKTDEIRVVDLTPRLAAALGDLQADTEKDALLAGADPCPWIFPSSTGTPLDPSAVAKTFRGVLRAAGLPRFRLYDLRHTFATHLLMQGAPITYVAAQLGHAKPTTTLTYYAHWIPSGDKRHIDRLEAIRSAARVGNGSNVVAAGDGDDRKSAIKMEPGAGVEPATY
jgi:integrase